MSSLSSLSSTLLDIVVTNLQWRVRGPWVWRPPGPHPRAPAGVPEPLRDRLQHLRPHRSWRRGQAASHSVRADGERDLCGGPLQGGGGRAGVLPEHQGERRPGPGGDLQSGANKGVQERDCQVRPC